MELLSVSAREDVDVGTLRPLPCVESGLRPPFVRVSAPYRSLLGTAL